MKDKLKLFGAFVALCFVFVPLFEAVSVTPVYTTQEGVILSVEEDPDWGFIGEDFRTVVKFPDKSVGKYGGDLGKEGDIVRVRVQVGDRTLFGIFGDYGQFWNKP